MFPVDFLQSIPFESIGVAVFALSGALMAARKGMDPFGFALLATLTGVGGGTIRDLLIGTRPVFWVGDPTDVLVCLIVAELVFALGPKRVAMLEGGRQGRVRALATLSTWWGWRSSAGESWSACGSGRLSSAIASGRA